MDLQFRRGALITFSGVDCSGKSTQLELVADSLRDEGVAVARVWNRVGYTAWFQALKESARRAQLGSLPAKGASFGRHKELGNPRTRAAWFAAASADLIRLYNFTIRRMLLAGKVVLCDRYLADSHVDLRLHFPEADLPSTFLWRSVVRLAPKPDLSLLFDVPLDVALQRAEEKAELYRQPDETVSDRIEAYREAASHYPMRRVDGTRNRGSIAQELYSLIRETAGERFRPGSVSDEIVS